MKSISRKKRTPKIIRKSSISGQDTTAKEALSELINVVAYHRAQKEVIKERSFILTLDQECWYIFADSKRDSAPGEIFHEEFV